ncbi:hypothetical protein HWV62_39649 [Athelia sp. TMB]|nr:hypothetical protein HWV62_39649 [Athelia sp. TMB]
MSDVIFVATTATALQKSIGPLFIGFIICLSLGGVGQAQILFYYYHFPRDGRIKKLMVIFLGAVDIIQTVVLLNLFWEILLLLSASLETMLVGTIELTSEAKATSSLVSFTAGAIGSASGHSPVKVASSTLAYSQAALLLVADGTISGSLIYYFNSSRIGLPRTEPVMRQLMWLSLNTGLLLW